MGFVDANEKRNWPTKRGKSERPAYKNRRKVTLAVTVLRVTRPTGTRFNYRVRPPKGRGRSLKSPPPVFAVGPLLM